MTDTDTKILLTFTQELTASDGLNSAGITLEYGRKRLGALKKLGCVKSRQVGQKVLYHTVRTPETEAMYALTETKTGSVREYSVVWYGEMLTLGDIGGRLSSSFDAISTKELTLNEILMYTLAILKLRSYRKSEGLLGNQPPDEEELRLHLLQRVKQARQELELAQTVLDTKVLWSGSPKVWSLISRNEPTSNVTKIADYMLKKVK